MKKIVKILSLFLIIMIGITNISLSIKAAETDCEALLDTVETLERRMQRDCDSQGSDSAACRMATRQYEAALESYESQCSGPPPCPYEVPFDVVPIAGGSMKVDGSPYYVSKFIIKSTGDVGFCVAPGAEYLEGQCMNYNERPANISTEQGEEIARIAYGWRQAGGSDSLFIAAQLAIWEVLGMPRTVNGMDKYGWGYEAIEEGMRGGSYAINYRVEFADDTIMMDLNDSYINEDTFDPSGLVNAFEHKGQGYELTESSGLSSSIVYEDGLVDGEMNRVYPLIKDVKVTPIVEKTTEGGDVTGGSEYVDLALNSQEVFSFNGSVNDTYYYYWYEDEYQIETKTGNLVIDKVDEWGDSVDNGIAFRVWFAKEDPNGTAIDSSGTKWSKYSGNGEFPGGLFYQEDGTDTFYTTTQIRTY